MYTHTSKGQIFCPPPKFVGKSKFVAKVRGLAKVRGHAQVRGYAKVRGMRELMHCTRRGSQGRERECVVYWYSIQ